MVEASKKKKQEKSKAPSEEQIKKEEETAVQQEEAPTEERTKEEPKKDKIIKKSTETIIVDHDIYNCEVVKTKITGDQTGTKEIVDSIIIKKKSSNKTVVRFKDEKEAEDFLDLCNTLAGQLRNDPMPHPQGAQQAVFSQGYDGEVEMIPTSEGLVARRVEPVRSTGQQDYDLAHKLLDKIGGGAPAAPKASNPYNEAMSGGKALSQQLDAGGLTEDQLTPEQKAQVAKYKSLMGVHHEAGSSPSARKGPSKLKQERQQKLLSRNK